jgi:hypothetical protein
MNRNKAGAAIIVALGMAAVSPAFAGVGTGVAGYCSLTTGNMASPMDVEQAQETIIPTIAQGANAISAAQKQQQLDTRNIWNQYNQSLTAFLKNLWASKAVQKAADQLGTQSQPSDICDAKSETASAASGAAAALVLKTQINANLNAWDKGTSSKTHTQEVISKMTTGQSSAQSVFNPDPNSTTTTSDANTYLTLITAPNPPVAMNSAQSKTPAGQRNKVLMQSWQLYTGIAQSAAGDVAVQNLPTAPGADALAKWQAIPGNAGTYPPGYNIPSGNISPNGLLDVQIAKRYANSNWYSDLNQGTQSLALKETTYMEAINLEQTDRELTMMEGLVNVSAAQYAIRTNQKNNAAMANASADSVQGTARGQ